RHTRCSRDWSSDVCSSDLDWSALDVWWGDERFLEPGDPERNETQARAALLDHVDVDESRVHPMPAAGVDSPEAGAERYAAQVTRSEERRVGKGRRRGRGRG